MKTLVIGDIHGGFRALKQVLEKIENPTGHRYIFVGDYVDGWSESSETISFLIGFLKTHDCIFLRGNHDELLYNYLKFQDNNLLWLNHGGVSGKKSYENLPGNEIEEHILFLEKLQNYYIDTENRLFVHAGFTSHYGPQEEYYPNTVSWDRTLWEMVCAMDLSISEEDEKYPRRLKLFKEIFIGHTPVTRLGETTPVNFGNVWNVDTGAAFKGPITIMDVQTKKIWQSDPVYQLYPSEKGRN